MEEIFAVIFVIYLIYLLIVEVIIPFVINYIIPFAAVVFWMVIAIAGIYALFMSFKAFCAAFTEHKDPWAEYVDTSTHAIHGAKRGYFFGPGLNQIKLIWQDSFKYLFYEMKEVGNIKDRNIKRYAGIFVFLTWNMWVYLFWLAASVSIYTFGLAWMLIFCAGLLLVISLGAAVFFIAFSILWLADRGILFFRAIQSRCPSCKRVSVVPLFECPSCGQLHENLTPGPYGIFRVKCSCGESLPLTAFNGRSGLNAFCPFCREALAAGAASQFGIQIIGSVSSGKTTFLAAFCHEYKKFLSKSSEIKSFSLYPQDGFDTLERWYSRGLSSSTTEFNADMYSIIHNVKGRETPYQFSFYDIAGEAFNRLEDDIQQQQFRYCEGLIFIIDSDISGSPEKAHENISNFIQEFRRLKGLQQDKMSDTPAALVIAKADVNINEIGQHKLIEEYNKYSSNELEQEKISTVKKSFWEFQDEICRKFLQSRGYMQLINLMDGTFTNSCIFPVSSMGHKQDGSKYSPWGVLDPVLWILYKQNHELYKIFYGLR